MARDVLLTFNPGSSTIKLGLFAIEDGKARAFGQGTIDLRHEPLSLQIEEGDRPLKVELKSLATDDLHGVIDETLGWLAGHFEADTLVAVAHRVVHGGDRFDGATRITDDTLAAIDALSPLAPLHQPQSLRLIRAVQKLRPDLPQSASFDTAFHRTQSDLVRRFALPRDLFDQGIKRYGFHGLSYKFIAGQLARDGNVGGRIIVAHLGSGASVCGLDNGVSRDTSMSFSTLDGIPMATRPGALDPGVLLHLLKEKRMSVDALEDMLYHRSGLLGVSGISADSRALADSEAPEAREAMALFALRVAREMAAIATTLGGLDALVFTAGIGEHQPGIRAAIAAHLEWLGARISAESNTTHQLRIDAPDGKIAVFVMHTD
ncbi:MAG: acetate kinase, partial [Variovorax sp.]|nr:acetate kinase [Variovorax sp.]